MDNIQVTDEQVSILDGIVKSVADDLHRLWLNDTPTNLRNEETVERLSKSSYDATLYVIQSFLDRFNEAAEQLKKSSVNGQ